MGKSWSCCRVDYSDGIKDKLNYIKDNKLRLHVGRLSLEEVEAMERKYKGCLANAESAQDEFDDCPLVENKEKLDEAHVMLENVREEIKVYQKEVQDLVKLMQGPTDGGQAEVRGGADKHPVEQG
jgi:hypothetical protein